MKERYWLKLLLKWKEKGRSGFTIPFIIGSQNYLPDDHDHQNISELMIDIIKNSDTTICLKYCLTTEDIILEINSKLMGSFPTHEGEPQTRLYLTSFLSDLGSTCEAIIENLRDRYQNYIDNSQFSKYERERGDYTPEEKAFIKEVFSKIP